MCEAHDKFIHHSINPHSPTHKLHSSVVGIVEYEVVCVEISQTFPTNSSSDCWDMVHIWFLDHGVHSLFDRTSLKFKASVFLPDRFKIEPRPIQLTLQECETPGMRNTCRRGRKVFMCWDDKRRRFHIRVSVNSFIVGRENRSSF